MKQKPGTRSRTRRGRLRPEQRRPASPGPLEDVGQDEHGHVAAHAVTLPGDLQQLADHRLLRGRIAVVELQRIRPAGEVRVAAVSQEPVAPVRLTRCSSAARAPGRSRCRGRSTRGGPPPRVIQAGVVGDEVEHQQQPARPEALAQTGQRRVSAQAGMHRVAGDREPGAGDVLLAAGPAASPRTPVATPGWRATRAAPAGPVRQTLRSQTQSNPIPATRSSSASGMSSSVAGRPRPRDRSVSQTRVLI